MNHILHLLTDIQCFSFIRNSTEKHDASQATILPHSRQENAGNAIPKANFVAADERLGKWIYLSDF